MSDPATYAVQLTPPGRSAIAVVLVAGPRAIESVDACFRAANGRPLDQQPINAIRFGRWRDARGEELVVCRLPLNETSREQVEVHCHGGSAAVRAVLDDLVGEGCRQVSWQEWLFRSGANALKNEAAVALASATTERTASVLFDQHEGALQRDLRLAVSALQAGDLATADKLLADLLRWLPLGAHLAEPWRVVLAGQPNVGKSRLMNALVGYERAIVYDRPGTTRDIVAATTAIDGWPVTFSDTAGVRDATDELELAGVALTHDAIAQADLVLVVAESSRESAAAWQAIESHLDPAQPRLRVATKSDLAAGVSHPESVVVTSAETGQGVETLLNAISRLLAPEVPSKGAGVPFLPRHGELLAAARNAIAQDDAAGAYDALQSLLAPDSAGLGSS